MYAGYLFQGTVLPVFLLCRPHPYLHIPVTFTRNGLTGCTVLCKAVTMTQCNQTVALPVEPFLDLQPLTSWKRAEPSGSVCLEWWGREAALSWNQRAWERLSPPGSFGGAQGTCSQ